MKEMKTLNGYEVVDAKAREDIEELKQNSGGGGSSDIITHRIDATSGVNNLTEDDKRILLEIYNYYSENRKAPTNYLIYIKASDSNNYMLVNNVMLSGPLFRLYSAHHTASQAQYYANIGISNGQITSYVVNSQQISLPSSGGVTVDYNSVGYSTYAYNNEEQWSPSINGFDTDKTLFITVDVQGEAGPASTIVMGRTDGWSWNGTTTLVDANYRPFTLGMRFWNGTMYYSAFNYYDTDSRMIYINSITVISNS